MSEWMPIDRAPKDKNIIGAYFNQPWSESHREGDIVKCWWQEEFSAFISGCREMRLAAGYKFESGKTHELHSPQIEPVTHWMLLPAAPDADVIG